MPICKCGCSKKTEGGEFCPGHDQTYRIQTADMVGGDIRLRELVDTARQYASGTGSLSDFSDTVRRIVCATK